MKIYLDNCCFNRPYDDQTQIRISLETQAKLYIQDLVKKKKLGVVETERFIAVINKEKFDYTDWQREWFSNMSSDEFNEAAVAYSKNNPFCKKE